jgi:hypothetical protein
MAHRCRPALQSRRHALAALSCAVVLLVAAIAAVAQDLDWKTGKLGHLAPYIGTYRYDAILDDPAVKSALRTLAGADTAHIVANLDVASPIAFVGGNLVLRGNAPHRGGLDEAIVLVMIYDGTVRAALLHDRQMKLFARDSEYAYVPRELKDFLRPRETEPKRESLPPGVEWVREPLK